MTQKEIKQVLSELTFIGEKCHFKHNKNIITVELVRMHDTKLMYLVYINGWFKGIWSDKKSDIGKRYLYEVYGRAMSKRDATILGTLRFKGKDLREYVKEVTAPVLIMFQPSFPSASAFAKKYATLEGLEVTDKGPNVSLEVEVTL